MPDAADVVEAAVRLCAACGMCCNGAMFHSVPLLPGDSARELSARGLKVKRGKKSRISQPCPAHKESHCAIYAHRPARCRVFVCRQLEALASGAASEADALGKIREAKALAVRVGELLYEAGDAREHKAFATRCESLFTEPLDPAPPAARLRDSLASAMSGLERFLVENFRPGGTDATS
ncbi:MAG: YkgJ family cysteine cluster protein [Verrucomicrobiae bacterium]